jgi:hypothetical protein
VFIGVYWCYSWFPLGLTLRRFDYRAAVNWRDSNLNVTIHSSTRDHCRAAILLLVGIAAFGAAVGPPDISTVTLLATGPELRIASNVGSTNQIQTATNLTQPAWEVLTNIVVAQTPYLYVDSRASSSPDSQRFYRVLVVSGGNPNHSPADMVLIPAGPFQMGDNFSEGAVYETPVHTVDISAFYMDKFEVSKGLWDRVKEWNHGNGYSYDNDGSGKATNHPVQSINWYDMIKWCNARSEMEGRVPAYYTDTALSQVYKIRTAGPLYQLARGIPAANRSGVGKGSARWSKRASISLVGRGHDNAQPG